MIAYFISDCHLDSAHPEAIAFFIRFVDKVSQQPAATLTILGDFFEVWIGDDAIEAWHQPIMSALRRCADKGIAITFMQGNRDFLIGARFCKAIGATLMADPTVTHFHGQPVLLMHGDLLCTDDVAYQKFRRLVRRPWLKRLFLCLPKNFRRHLAARARAQSKAHTQTTEAKIMDVNATTVNATVQRYQTALLIHGHTHRPVIETRTGNNGASYQRIVLGDWYRQASILVWPANQSPRLKTVSFVEKDLACMTD